jgi:hypothetical protein
MKKLIRKTLARCTWKNARWFARVNVAGWIVQGVIFGLLTLIGVGALAALVSAKVANWVVFIGQLVKAGSAA